MKKRVLSIVSIVLMIMMVVDITAFAQDTNNADNFEIYLANYYLNYGEYYIFDYEGPYRTYVEELQNDKTFQNSLYGWRAATFNLSSEAKYSQKEYAYCQTILFDVLYDGESFPNVLGNVQNGFKRVNASAWKQLCKLDASITKKTKITSENADDINKQLKEIDDFSDALKVIGNLQTYVGYVDTVYELVEKVAKVQAIMDLPDEYAAIFSEMGATSSNYPPLQYALQEFSTICSNSLTTEQITLLFSSEEAFNEISQELLGAVWKEVMSACGSVGMTIQTGQAMGKYASNLLFSTDKTIETYYTLENLYYFENVLKSKVRTYATAFENNPTVDNARKFNASVQLLYSTYKIGIDYAVDFVEVIYGDGIVNQIYKTLNKEKYEDIKDSLYFIQNCIRNFFDYSEEIAYGSFVEEYGLDAECEDIILVDITTDEFVEIMENVEAASVKLSDFNVTKNVTLTGDVVTYGDLYVKSGVTLNLNGFTMEIGGDAEIEGDINLLNGTLKIGGNVLHSDGTVTFNQGSLLVGGDYRIQTSKTDSAGNPYYGYGYGTLVMKYANDLMEVGGDFVTDSCRGSGINSYDNYFTAGTMKFSGDVIQKSTLGYTNFKCTGTHKVILNGTDEQTISFASKNCCFNTLELTKKIDNYEFSPNPCWNELITIKIPVEEVVLSKKEIILDAGEEFELTVQVLPTDADNQTVNWSSSNTAVATVENGKVTALKEGSAVITVTTEDGNKTAKCSVTVACNHVLSKVEAVASTCVKEGNVEYFICGKCDKKYADEAGTKEITNVTVAVNPKNHIKDGTEIRNVVAVTATKDGYTGDTYCKGCGVKLKTGTTIPATGSNTGESNNTDNTGSGDETTVESGWYEQNGAKYWYENGVKQGTEGRGKEIYDGGTDAWYWLDAVDSGKIAVSKDVYQDSEAGDWGDIMGEDGKRYGKWVRYDENGHMIKGWQDTEAGRYFFDSTYGTMAKGYATIDGVEYYFNPATGVLEQTIGEVPEFGWKNIDGKDYWYENYIRQGYSVDGSYRGKEIYDGDTDAWYWLDNIQGGAKAVSKDVYQESLAGDWGDYTGDDGELYGKWVRYDENGHMIKGWQETDAGTYYFDLIYGTMAKGTAVIDGAEYYFDTATGIRQ